MAKGKTPLWMVKHEIRGRVIVERGETTVVAKNPRTALTVVINRELQHAIEFESATFTITRTGWNLQPASSRKS